MSPEINFIAAVAVSVTEEFDKPIDKVSHSEFEEKARDHFDNMTESELRDLYRKQPIEIDDQRRLVPNDD